ncbi:MAG: hypothetical protein WD000_01800 [Thermodesulfobacteriota bacterium]
MLDELAKIIKLYLESKKRIVGILAKIDKDLKIPRTQTPALALTRTRNFITLGIELLDSYYGLWKVARVDKDKGDKIREENVERIIELQKMIIISSLSGVEYALKEYLSRNPEKLGNINSKTPLKEIFIKSKQCNIIEDEEFILWEGLIKFRNIIVHNDAISDITRSYNYPKCQLELVASNRVKGNLMLCNYLIDWMIDAIATWIRNIETKK